VAAKHWFILQNNNNYRRFSTQTAILDQPFMDRSEDQSESSGVVLAAPEPDYSIQEFFPLMVQFWEKNLPRLFKDPLDLRVAAAIVNLFRDTNGIDVLFDATEHNTGLKGRNKINKYMRGSIGCSVDDIRRVADRMKDVQRLIYKEYLETGTVAL
jgi:hypothetical protein